jgi:glucose/arabinose dehydrogenase
MTASKPCFLLVLLLIGGQCGVFVANSDADDVPELQLQPIADGFTSPHYLVTPPDDARRFVLDLTGQIWVLDQDGRRGEQPFLDLTDRMVDLDESYDERGLLGLAFHPDYASNGRFFVYYSAPLREEGPRGWNHTSRLSEFRVSENPGRADADSERIVLTVDQPQMNHNGGRILFGADGYLYVGLGDGGAAGDLGEGHPPLGNGQDVSTLKGSVLRIDVEQTPYGIPEDNPLVRHSLPSDAKFAGERARDEIWAWGIRNAWGMAFDRESGDLYVADVGQNLWEEVNRMRGPGNYGWRLEEGTHGFNPDDMDEVIPDGPESGPLGEPLIEPAIEYRNVNGHETGTGSSVIGGYVYRGAAIPGLTGRYVFGDWTTVRGKPAGAVLVSQPTVDKASRETWPFTVAVEQDQYVLGFGEDAAGELYVLTSNNVGPKGQTGRIFKVTPIE